jgi:3-phenylpropionate/cinnamic acid dioxygenase small subunit
MSARDEIMELMSEYAWTGDHKQFDRFHEVFAEDFQAEYEGFSAPIDGLDEQIRFARMAVDPLDGTQHIFTNFKIEIDGDNARFRLYTQAAHMKDGETLFVAGNYHMEARKTPKGWRLTKLRFVPMWSTGDASMLGHLTASAPA